MKNLYLLFTTFIGIELWCCCYTFHVPTRIKQGPPSHLSLTISARYRHLEISWHYSEFENGDIIVLTDKNPAGKFTKKSNIETSEGSGSIITGEYGSGTGIDIGSGMDLVPDGNNHSAEDSFFTATPASLPEKIRRHSIDWQYGNRSEDVLFELEVLSDQGWETTDIIFDYELSRNVTVNTSCYGYWVTIIKPTGNPVMTNCIRAYPTWMNDMKNKIENFKIRDLFIPGTHDSSSYREYFNPRTETIVAKYSLTQDENIRGQLLHGIRYLDIRVGYYRATNPQFWANHGISKQHPLINILRQVKDFVLETNEIVILDFQEFPVGFGKTRNIHRLLVQHILNELKELMVDPSVTWQGTLKQIWQQKRNIIISYDKDEIVHQFRNSLFQSVEQKWGNRQDLSDLKRYLVNIRRQGIMSYTSRPIAEMAELTPDTWGVITDVYGGLRTLADQTNRNISKWYASEWGSSSNVVAVDFYRGTTIVPTALYWNSIKFIS